MDRELLFGLTGGESFVVAFIVVAIVTAPWWPRLGERLVAGPPPDPSEDPGEPPK